MSPLHVAVIIPAYNVAPYLRDAVGSVLGQTHSDWSLIIVDDGSTDQPESVLADLQDPRIRLIRQPNAGVSAARNTGIRAATGADHPAIDSGACLFLDGDDWLAPDALACLVGELEAAPWAIAACARYARVTQDGVLRRVHPARPGIRLDALLTRNLFANGGHLLIRTSAIAAAGGFREDLSYGEDWEYWTRLALLGAIVSIATTAPLLFVRERAGGAMLSRASDPQANRPALDAIYANPAITRLIPAARLKTLRRKADSETAWAVGRELIRHRRHRDGRRWLARSLRQTPTPRRFALIALAWFAFGPFRPYGTTS